MSSPTFATAPLLLFAILILFLLLRRISAVSGYRKNLPLPPGSLGWPYIGETFQLYSGRNPNLFFASKQAKYGSIFKTHVLRCRCVMVSSPEAVRYVLVGGADKFRPTFPASKERILGEQAMFFHQGEYHSRLRKLLLRAFSPESIRGLVSDIDSIANCCLASLQGRTVNTFHEMKTYTFNVALLTILGKGEWSHKEGLKRCYYALERGYNSMGINLPGTLFRKALRARADLSHILANIIADRRHQQSTAPYGNDLLASLMSDDQGLTDDQIADNVIGVLFAARDTTASVLTWVVKFLAENPSVLKSVVEEQEAILAMKAKGEGSRILTWDDTKRMPLTSRVLSETLRVASILSFTFREAIEDVELEGYFIPKGWKVLPLFRNLHHCPSNFPHPEKFDPSRFEVAPKPNTYLPFGNGIHSCTGNELARLEILVLVHHLTTKYRWTIMGPQNKIQYRPFALPQDGLLIHFLPKTQED